VSARRGTAAREAASDRITLASHPRAAAQVARAKGYGALGAFGLTAALSWHAGAPLFDTGVRALAGGVAGYMVAWSAAVTVWRHLLLAQLRAAAARSTTRRER